ncbi:hypothetical protein DEAC_c02450 [Desulfosporosinus acididurans]|uniref:Sce7726 family protein n=1 Tax=Desulfosporosinus acididurans TaxID=476652 RepID=A0A0J1FXU8_9FIRM|nr:sce7726 family protein [Desulfosporosinus acididurans]KLU67838.1 hypothetical protein DEAC_c02450 [Desulfosporosinus acididurans]
MKVYDKDIRKLLVEKFLNMKHFTSDPSTKLIYEMDICYGSSRVDVAVVNGKMHGYEIKSERDSLERLPYQIKAYNMIFDTVSIVAANDHLEKVNTLIPEFWGIYSVEKNKNEARLVRKRQAKINPSVDIFSVSQLLWKEELISLLMINGICKGIKSKTRQQLGRVAVEKIDCTVIKDFVRKSIKSREEWKAVELKQLYGDLPIS